MGLVLGIKYGEEVCIGEDIKIYIHRPNSNKAAGVKMNIIAPDQIVISHEFSNKNKPENVCSKMSEDEKISLFEFLEKDLDYLN